MKKIAVIIALMIAGALDASAISFALDSIAEWGKFPRFCVNTYRWGCDFFNGYDTTYVTGTGHPFNIKLRTESWTDYYHIKFENDTRMDMIAHPSTTVGFHLTYLAVSAGYDMNMSKYFSGQEKACRRFNFQFNCMLFGASLYFISNDIGTNINAITPVDGPRLRPNLPFNGINNTEWGIDLSYFFKHKRYSAAAAFNFSRVQIKSGGSFFAGFNFNRINYNFDFSDLPEEYLAFLPTLPDNTYKVNTSSYLLKCGYGYNLVFKPKWIIGLSESPMIGVTHSYIPLSNDRRTRFGLLNVVKGSIVFNSGNWFAGAIFTGRIGLGHDIDRTLVSAYFTAEVSAGWRFSLW